MYTQILFRQIIDQKSFGKKNLDRTATCKDYNPVVAFLSYIEFIFKTPLALVRSSIISIPASIVSAVDNDEMGKLYTKKFKELLPWNIVEHYPILNDYNDDLKQSKIKGIKL